MVIYHVSKHHPSSLLIPKIPNNLFTEQGFEDSTTPRISFAPTVGKCLLSLSGNIQNNKYYVYATNTDSVKHHFPTNKELPDAHITNEVWVLEKVSSYFIGTIRVNNSNGVSHDIIIDGKKEGELCEWDYEWLIASEPGVDNEFLQYLGMPYKSNGRSSDGLSCYGFVRYIYHEQYNVDLPTKLPWVDNQGVPESFFDETNWPKHMVPEIGDIVVFDSRNLENGVKLRDGEFYGIYHFGIYVGKDLILHNSSWKGSHVSKLSSFRASVYGYYAPEGKSITKGVTKVSQNVQTKHQYKRINNTDPYFKYEKDSIRFVGSSLVVRIPKSYIDSKFCFLGNKIKTLGVFNMIFDNKYECNFIFTNFVEITPSDTDLQSDDEYILATFKQNDIFMPEKTVLKLSSVLHPLFNSFINLGKIPSFLTYEEADSLFDNTKIANGVSLPVGHEILEFITSHMFRDKKDPKIFFRHVSEPSDPEIIGLQNTTYAPQSATSKLLGPYLDDGFTGILIDDNLVSDPVERLLTE